MTNSLLFFVDWAVINDRKEVVEFLTGQEVDCNITDKTEKTALDLAIEGELYEIAVSSTSIWEAYVQSLNF